MSKTPILGAGTNFTRTNAQGNGYIASFITDAGDPSLLNIPGGNWNLEIYFNASSGGGNPQFYGEIYKVSAANVFTLVASGSVNPEGITNGTTVDQYFTSIPVPQTSLLITDRLAVRIYVIPAGRTITLHTENGNLCEVLTTFSTGLNALNGLTAQVQYFATGTSGTDFAISSSTDTHTFNLPTASATNRGALSSADWSTFSGKVGGSGATGQVAYWNGTNSQTGSTNLLWDNAAGRLNINTSGSFGNRTMNVRSTGLNIIELKGGAAASQGSALYVQNANNTAALFAIGDAAAIIGGTPDTSVSIYTNTSVPLLFNIGASERARFFANGNFNIGGTTDGGQRLQVQGDAFIKGSGATSATNALLVQNSGGTTTLTLNNAGNLALGVVPSAWNSDVKALQVSTGSIFSGIGYSFIGQNHVYSLSGDLFLGTGYATTYGQANGVHRWLISTASGTAGNVITFTQAMTLDASGNLALGTTTANAKLEVRGAIRTSFSSGDAFLEMYSGGSAGYIEQKNANPLVTIVNGSERMRLTSNGRLLLGTSTESTFLLDVNGTARVSNTSATILTLNSTNGTGYSAIKIDASGVEKALIGFGTYLTSDGGVAIRTAASTPFTIAIGGGVPTLTLATTGAATFSSSVTATNAVFDRVANDSGSILRIGNATTYYDFSRNASTGALSIQGNQTGANNIIIAPTSGNLLVGTTTDNGSRFQVSGAATFSSTVTAANSIFNSTTQAISANSGGYIIAAGRIGGSNGGNIFSNNGTGTNFIIAETGTNIFAIGGGLLGGAFNGIGITLNTSTGEATFSSSVTAGAVTNNASAILQADSSTKGFLPPRMTTTQKNAIGTPAAGLVVYDTDTNKLCCYNGSTWNDLF
jgi:hypothetical protein